VRARLSLKADHIGQADASSRKTVWRLSPGYIALVHKDEGTSYGVSFPDVPGCISAGDTFEKVVANAAEALTGHFALMRRTARRSRRRAASNSSSGPRFCRR
jgi:predicted RNase H-like HicB family nuclease